MKSLIQSFHGLWRIDKIDCDVSKSAVYANVTFKVKGKHVCLPDFVCAVRVNADECWRR